jgi:UDP-2,4-diacetamido-2,4,6-trideoxy-beta-L-altropyranose hydrolase
LKTRSFRIALRADASQLIGLGHVKRCLSLAIALRELGFELRLITRSLSVDSASMAREAGVYVLLLPEPTEAQPDDYVAHSAWAGVSWWHDAAQTADALKDWSPDWVIVDHYAFDARWQQYISSTCNTRIGVIDDLGDRELFGELLIDQNLHVNHRKKYLGLWPSDSRILGGPRYALLGPAFTGVKPLAISNTVSSIGIFMGGVDASGLSIIALRACREFAGFTGRIEVVATKALVGLHELISLAQKWPDTEILCDLPDLASFFRRHDLQIGAAGGASWERCAVGAPSLLLLGADNQKPVISALREEGAVATLDPDQLLNEASVSSALLKLLDEPDRRTFLSKRSHSLVDGLGATRVALAIGVSTLELRNSGPEDAVPTFHWRNHPETRRFFHDSSPLQLAEHCSWWDKTLIKPDCKLFIAFIGSRDVGVLRLDLKGNIAHLSIYIDPDFHGLGIGKEILRAAQKWASQDMQAPWRLEAEVLASNIISQRTFAKVGFMNCEQCWIWEPSK